MSISPNDLRVRIQSALMSEAGLAASVAADVAFHLTDWLDDLDQLNRFYRDPASLTDREVNEFLIQFLLHVPNHLAAACKLLTDIPVSDIFEVGATADPDDD